MKTCAYLDHLHHVFRALAEDDRAFLATVSEHIQADLDTIIAERATLRTKLAEAEKENERLRDKILGLRDLLDV
jgi:hypothetical protein